MADKPKPASQPAVRSVQDGMTPDDWARMVKRAIAAKDR